MKCQAIFSRLVWGLGGGIGGAGGGGGVKSALKMLSADN